MRNFIIFLVLCSIVLLSIFIGTKKFSVSDKQSESKETVSPPISNIPSIGRIEVLNGCGEPGAASKVADFLRAKSFDVKSIGNAESWNYPFTIVVSRTEDMTTAEQVCAALHTDKLILLRTGDELYNVSVLIGTNFGELIQ